MTNDKIKALDDLIAAVESGSAISMDARCVCHGLGWEFPDTRTKWILSAEIGSLDAAKALHEALLPRWTWEIMTINYPEKTSYVVMLKGRKVRDLMASGNQKPARAWLIAILKAYKSTLLLDRNHTLL